MIGVALMLAGAQTAWAHQDPPNSPSTGVTLSITAYRADCVTPIGGSAINQCETVCYDAMLSWANPPNAAIEGGTLCINPPAPALPTCFGAGFPATLPIPCLGGTMSDPALPNPGGPGDTCTVGVNSYTTTKVLYTAVVATCATAPAPPTTITTNAVYSGGIAHNGTPDGTGVGASTPSTIPVVCCALNSGECKADDFCDPTLLFGLNNSRKGTCAVGANDPESTVCTDTDGNLCTTAGCDFATGLCDQAHVPVICTDDGNLCNGVEACNPANGLCDQPNAPESTVCPDTDGNLCTTAGCDFATGACDQAHVPVVCVDPICTECNTGTGVCDPIDPVPAECGVPGNEICRTPGFWGTHGGTEKEGNSTNITQALLDAYNNANDPDLTICGRVINNTDAGNVNSALEAICVSPKGDSRLQLARQLTAAALNCIITNSGDGIDACVSLTGAVCDGVSVEGIFEGCNQACVFGNVSFDYDHDNDVSTPPVSVSCISAIDCFNGGGVFDPSDGSCDEAIVESCHDRDLDNGCFDFQPPGAAGSPRECNEARKNDITVPPPPLVNECVKEAVCGAAAVCGTTETCEGACFFTAAGNTRCFTGEFGCTQPACVTDADCPANFACSNTCCGLQCAPLCGTPFPLGAPAGGLSSSIQ